MDGTPRGRHNNIMHDVTRLPAPWRQETETLIGRAIPLAGRERLGAIQHGDEQQVTDKACGFSLPQFDFVLIRWHCPLRLGNPALEARLNITTIRKCRLAT